MAIIAAGARHDPVTNTVQAVVIITDDDGLGHPDQLNPHKLNAAERGHNWVEIPSHVYNQFNHHNDLIEHVTRNIPKKGGQ